MKGISMKWVGLMILAGLLPVLRLEAQQHRATRLGHPSTRFAPPLDRPEQLRALFANEKLKADVESILDQAGWKGDVEDLRRAAANAPIRDLQLPTGSRLPYMSSRKDGKPVALIDVLWAGKEPIQAYVFEFNSKGRRYQCITPRPCSNFYTVDLGPLPAPALTVHLSLPSEATVCSPIDGKVLVRNPGDAPARQVRLAVTLPAGLVAEDANAALSFEVGELAAGAGREYPLRLRAASPGTFVSEAAVTSTGAKGVQAKAGTVFRAPVLALECTAPAQVLPGRPVEICLTVNNTGDAPEPGPRLILPIPEGATFVSASDSGTGAEGRIAWELSALAPRETRRLCAVVTSKEPRELRFAGSVQGVCASPADSQCATRVIGVPAILLEVVDLEDPIEVGNEVTYEIRVLNQGSAPGTNIKLVCHLPPAQEFVSGGGVSPVRAEGRKVFLDPLPSFLPKQQAMWSLRVKALTAGDTRFKVELTSDQFPQPIEETEATEQY